MMPKPVKYFPFTLLILILSACTTIQPSDAEAGEVNFNTVKTYATLSALSYEPVEIIREAIKQYGYSLTQNRNIPDINMTYFLITNTASKTQIIVVRGTANIENAIVDASVKLVNDPLAGIPLHEGFAYSARAVYNDIKPLLKPDFTINTTGHSLGGAVASILAMYLHAENYQSKMTITFGQPKVTNITGANRYSQLPILRVVTSKDMVPLVPPFDPLEMTDINIYWHPGIELVLNPDNTYSTLSGIDSMLRAVNFVQTVPTEENLMNHKMTYYLQLIDNKLSQAREVPYKSPFNPLNWIGN